LLPQSGQRVNTGTLSIGGRVIEQVYRAGATPARVQPHIAIAGGAERFAFTPPPSTAHTQLTTAAVQAALLRLAEVETAEMVLVNHPLYRLLGVQVQPKGCRSHLHPGRLPDIRPHRRPPRGRRGRQPLPLSTMDTGRSYKAIVDHDLDRLSALAGADRERFFVKRPEYRHRLIGVALCQGAGLHYRDIASGKAKPNGIKDFDVWSFFAAIPGQRFPADRRMTHVDFGPSRFGRWIDEPARFRHYQGRRVDLLMRALLVDPHSDPVEALRRYVREASTVSAKRLAAKGVVMIDPVTIRGQIVWPS
jgi:hypothetical protein